MDTLEYISHFEIGRFVRQQNIFELYKMGYSKQESLSVLVDLQNWHKKKVLKSHFRYAKESTISMQWNKKCFISKTTQTFSSLHHQSMAESFFRPAMKPIVGSIQLIKLQVVIKTCWSIIVTIWLPGYPYFCTCLMHKLEQ